MFHRISFRFSFFIEFNSMVFCVLTHTHQKQTFPIMMQETWPSLAKKISCWDNYVKKWIQKINVSEIHMEWLCTWHTYKVTCTAIVFISPNQLSRIISSNLYKISSNHLLIFKSDSCIKSLNQLKLKIFVNYIIYSMISLA